MRSIEGNFTVADPVEDYLANFPPTGVSRLGELAMQRAPSLHDKALDTLVHAPQRPAKIGEGMAIVETSALAYSARRGIGHVSLMAEVMLPFSAQIRNRVLAHARDELSPVFVIAGPTLRRTEHDRRLFELRPDALLKTLAFGKTVEASQAEVNYLGILIGKMRKTWGLEAKNK